jgi:hypothetical protein
VIALDEKELANDVVEELVEVNVVAALGVPVLDGTVAIGIVEPLDVTNELLELALKG